MERKQQLLLTRMTVLEQPLKKILQSLNQLSQRMEQLPLEMLLKSQTEQLLSF